MRDIILVLIFLAIAATARQVSFMTPHLIRLIADYEKVHGLIHCIDYYEDGGLKPEACIKP